MPEFRIAPVFSDRCVLQRDKEISVFGEAGDGQKIKVTLLVKKDASDLKYDEYTAETHAAGGRWTVKLPAQKAAGYCELVAECGEKVQKLCDIAIGEVWLLGGQSNMEFELQNCTTGKKHLENDHPDVRFYYTQKKGYIDEDFLESEAKTAWSKFGPESAKCWSAAGYIFGKKLSEALNVTVGLIGCNWGGTSASAWMSPEALKEDAGTGTYLDDYEKNIAGKSDAVQKAEYDAYLKEADVWNQKYSKLWEEKPGIDWAEAEKTLGKNPWPGPINSYNPFRPGGLHECMILRVCPYTLRGFTFYQGESDDHKPGFYYTLFSRMIKQWRDDWGEELPFVFVQLPGHRYESDPDYKHWCIIREAQQKVADTVPGTAMACIIDAGEFNDIHPKDKEPVGDRMYRVAMEKVYSLMDENEAESPEPYVKEIDNSTAVIAFKHVGEGLVIKAHGDDKTIAGFELAGADKVFCPAKAVLSLDAKEVYLSASGVDKPEYVRYLWSNYPEKINLYSRFSLPVRPFRTDSDDANEVRDIKIQQIMEL